MSAADKKKLDGIKAGASSYTHPTYTARAGGLYKVAVDSLGHVSSAAAVTKSDITALGIPAQDTNTTYGAATANASGLMSAADKKKLDTLWNYVNQSVYFLLYDDVKTGGKVAFYARGCMATLMVTGVTGVNVGTPLKVATDKIPKKFRPDLSFYSSLVHRQSNNIGQIWVPGKTDAEPHVYIYAGVASSGLTNSLYGTVSWIYTDQTI